MAITSCKEGCGLQVEWRLKGNDGKKPRWQCFNAGTDIAHWDSCSAARTKRVMAEGTPFKDANGEGYIFNGKKKYHHMVATTHFGKRVK